MSHALEESAVNQPGQNCMPKKGSKRGPVRKKYNPKWELDELLKTWIMVSPKNDEHAFCRYCNSNVRAHKNCLLEHTRTMKHQRAYKSKSSFEDADRFDKLLDEQFQLYKRKERPVIQRKSVSSPSTSSLQPPKSPSDTVFFPVSSTSTTPDSDASVGSTTATTMEQTVSETDQFVIPLLSDANIITENSENIITINWSDIVKTYGEHWPPGETCASIEGSSKNLVNVIIQQPAPVSSTSTLQNTTSISEQPSVTITLPGNISSGGFQPVQGNMRFSEAPGFQHFTIVNGVSTCNGPSDALNQPTLSPVQTVTEPETNYNSVPLFCFDGRYNASPETTSSPAAPDFRKRTPATLKYILDSLEQDPFSTSDLIEVAHGALRRIENEKTRSNAQSCITDNNALPLTHCKPIHNQKTD